MANAIGRLVYSEGRPRRGLLLAWQQYGVQAGIGGYRSAPWRDGFGDARRDAMRRLRLDRGVVLALLLATACGAPPSPPSNATAPAAIVRSDAQAGGEQATRPPPSPAVAASPPPSPPARSARRWLYRRLLCHPRHRCPVLGLPLRRCRAPRCRCDDRGHSDSAPKWWSGPIRSRACLMPSVTVAWVD
jgi:hypothetical protein